MKDAILITENLDRDSLLSVLNTKYNFYFDKKNSIYYDDINPESEFISFLNGEEDISRFYEGEEKIYVYKTLNNPSFFYVEFLDRHSMEFFSAVFSVN